MSRFALPSSQAASLRLYLARDPLFFAALAAVAGILVAHADVFPAWSAASAGVAGAVLAWIFRQKWIVLVTVAAGFASLHGFRESQQDRVALLWKGEDATQSVPVTISGTIIQPPDRYAEGRDTKLVVLLDWIVENKVRIECRNRLYVWGPALDLEQGDRIVASGRLSRLPEPRNPGEFSWNRYARDKDGVVAELNVPSKHQLQVTGVAWRYRVFHYALEARWHVARAITLGLDWDSPAAQVLRAMVLGAREDADPETEEPFRLSGALHIFAVSGLHVGIFGTVIWIILRLFGVPRRHAIGVIILCVLSYAFITGLRPSAVRAALMTTVFLGGFCLRRQSRLLNSLGLAAMVILFFDSRQLFSVGFQLSFCVLLAISWLAAPIRSKLHALIEPDPLLPASLVPKLQWKMIGAGKGVADIVSVSLAAWLGSTPLIIWYFGLVTPVAVLANCFLVPIAWLVLFTATISILLVTLHLGFLAAWLNQLNAAFVALLQKGAVLFSMVPYGHFELTPLSDRVDEAPSKPGMVVFDLGRSCGPQAIHVKDPLREKSQTWLVDSGSDGGYLGVIRPWLRKQGVTRLDGFVSTHGDTSHIGAAPELVADYEPVKLVESQMPSRSSAFRDLKQFRESREMSSLQVAGGTEIRLTEKVWIEVLFPPPGYPDQAGSDDECLVLMIHWGEWRVLSMADSGFKTEKWLLRSGLDLSADVLVKSQHGVDFSGLAEFIKTVSPAAVIATNDRFPKHEAIDSGWREMVRRYGAEVFDQSETGAVSLDFSDDTLEVSSFLNDQTLTIRRR